jgi:hypothetical protein
MGHGGGDFFVLYYFARQILFGEPAPWDIYNAADVTIPGILAYRSSIENGKPFDIPDFRKKADRDKWRNDTFALHRYDVEKGCFPRKADKSVTGLFSLTMRNLFNMAGLYEAYTAWSSVADDLETPSKVVEMADALIKDYPLMAETLRKARQLADAYPRCDGGRILNETLGMFDEEKILRPDYLRDLKRDRAKLKRKLGKP